MSWMNEQAEDLWQFWRKDSTLSIEDLIKLAIESTINEAVSRCDKVCVESLNGETHGAANAASACSYDISRMLHNRYNERDDGDESDDGDELNDQG